MDVAIVKCGRREIGDIWPIIRNWLVKCIELAPPWWSIGDLLFLCLRGDYIAWFVLVDGVPRGVALAALVDYPSIKICCVPWIAGEKMKIWLPKLQEAIEGWAKESGAKYLSGGGRKGWIRASGMKEVGIILSKEL